MAKIFKFLVLDSLVKNLIARSPEIYANTKLIAIYAIFKALLLKIISCDLYNSKINEPKITGIESKNENLTHSSLFIPKNLANEIVDPDLDNPGSIAIACPIPTIAAIR